MLANVRQGGEKQMKFSDLQYPNKQRGWIFFLKAYRLGKLWLSDKPQIRVFNKYGNRP